LNFIIYDIEATCWHGQPPGGWQEVIEIGAVKVDDYGEVVDTFDLFIKPIVNPILSGFCKKLTNISQENVDRAGTYDVVIEQFKDWISVYEDEFTLASWGNFDKRILMNNCELHKLEDDWLENHINLKNQYKTMRNLRLPTGLKKTTEIEGFEFTGIHHRAISDAENLAKIFSKYIREWQY